MEAKELAEKVAAFINSFGDMAKDEDIVFLFIAVKDIANDGVSYTASNCNNVGKLALAHDVIGQVVVNLAEQG